MKRLEWSCVMAYVFQKTVKTRSVDDGECYLKRLGTLLEGKNYCDSAPLLRRLLYVIRVHEST